MALKWCIILPVNSISWTRRAPFGWRQKYSFLNCFVHGRPQNAHFNAIVKHFWSRFYNILLYTSVYPYIHIHIYIHIYIYMYIGFNWFFTGFSIKLDITIEFAIKNSIDSWIQNEFLWKFIFLSFFYAGGAGNPPGGSGDTRDRFYIDKKRIDF